MASKTYNSYESTKHPGVKVFLTPEDVENAAKQGVLDNLILIDENLQVQAPSGKAVTGGVITQ